MNNDLTIGNPSKVLWKFCMPLFGSVIFQQLYNLSDGIVAGKFIGENSLAAVGNSSEITLIFLAFAFGCNIGGSVIISRFFGAKDFKNMKTAVYTTLLSTAVVCTLLMIIGILGNDTMLHLMNTPEEIFNDSKLYLDIYVYGLPFVFLYNVSTGVFSALGDSKTPFIFLAISSLSNIALNIWFVTYFKMGIAGVALATFLCEGASCIISIIVVLKRLAKISCGEKPKPFDKTIFKKIVIIAVPSILQQSFISVGNILIQGIINGFGPAVIAGYSASVKLNNLVITSFTTIGNGISNYTSQNLGANKKERVHQGFKSGIKMMWILCVPLVLLYFFAGKYLMYLFIDNPTTSAISSGFMFLKILSPFYLIVSAKLATDGILRGAGMMNKFMIATFSDLVLRVLLAFVLSSAFGWIGIWCAWPIGWIVGMIISLCFYFNAMKVSKFK